jgi:ppGpp synthetase/RelA/SpoT-type nucleotidyltranferase
MKIPASIRKTHEQIRPAYEQLQAKVDKLIRASISKRWHYESRVKELESYALKLETSREKHPARPEDMLGCTVVVENHSRIADATAMVVELFKLEYRRPEAPDFTFNRSDSFAFDDLRLYVSWHDDPTLPATGLEGLLFEVQVKTFLQHAWGIATHDLIYKSDEVSWGSSRVAYQVKAMLENAELSITEAKRLTSCALLDRADKRTKRVQETMEALKQRWSQPGTLPKNLQGLANNVINISETLRIPLDKLWTAVDVATANGGGASLLNLSPYAAILDSLLKQRGPSLLDSLGHKNNERYLFVPDEVPLPQLNPAVSSWIIKSEES